MTFSCMYNTKMMFAKFYLHVGQLQFYMYVTMLSSRAGTFMHAVCNYTLGCSLHLYMTGKYTISLTFHINVSVYTM